MYQKFLGKELKDSEILLTFFYNFEVLTKQWSHRVSSSIFGAKYIKYIKYGNVVFGGGQKYNWPLLTLYFSFYLFVFMEAAFRVFFLLFMVDKHVHCISKVILSFVVLYIYIWSTCFIFSSE